MLWIRIRIKLDPKPDPHQSEKQDPDPDPHQSEKVEALEGHFGALEGPIWEKVNGRIRIKNRIKLKSRIRIKFASASNATLVLLLCAVFLLKNIRPEY